MYKFIVNLFFFTTIFPYITPIRLGTDIQPYSMLFSFAIILFGIRLNWKNIAVIIFGTFSVILLLISELEFSDFRSCLSVISFCSTYLAFTAVLEDKRFSGSYIELWCWAALITYGLAAILQYVVDPTIFSFISPRTDSNSGFQGRGVESLTAEPTFYGFVILFLCLIYIHLKGRFTAVTSIFWLIGLVEILFFAKSASALLSFAIILPSYLFVFGGFNKILKYILILVAIPIFFTSVAVLPYVLGEDSRAAILAAKVSDPIGLLENDLSVSDRIFNIYYAYKGAMSNFLVPHGFGNWFEYLIEASSENTLVANVTGEDERILSLLGGVLYEFGFLSLPFFFVFAAGVSSTVKTTECGWPAFILVGISYFVLFSQAIPLSHPMFSLFLALQNSKNKKNNSIQPYDSYENNLIAKPSI